MNRKLPSWLAFCAICVCAGLLVLAAHGIAADTIARQAEKLEAMPRASVLAADAFEACDLAENSRMDCLYEGRNAGGEAVGYVGLATVTGYRGPIEITVGVDMDGAITGVLVGGESFDETPGLGSLTRETTFVDQFKGHGAEIELNADGVDGIAGATISSRAVVSGVNAIVNGIYADKLGLLEETAEPYAGQTVSAAKQGFGGDVTVTVGFAQDDTIEYLSIDTPNETDGLGKRASESAFTGQFVGKRAPFAYGEDGIEAISGATITSNAVLEALNAIASGEGEASAEPVTAEAQGFGGSVTITVRLDGDNAIAALTIDTPNETDGLGKRASESAFTGQFVGKRAPFAYGEDGIEAISGATITSNAVLEAINSLLPADGASETPVEAPAEESAEAPAEESAEAPSEEPAEAPAEEPTEAPAEEPAEAPAEESAEAPAEALFADGAYAAEKANDFSTVQVNLTVADGKITACSIAASGAQNLLQETTAGEWAASIVEAQNAETDAITGATLRFSAATVQEIVEELLAQASADGAAEAPAEESAEAPVEALFADGAYAAEKANDFSTVQVNLTVADGKITACSIAASGAQNLLQETTAGEWAASIVEAQSAETDAITGATLRFSAATVQEIVEELLAQASKG